MRAIAVLDDPAEIDNETSNETEEIPLGENQPTWDEIREWQEKGYSISKTEDGEWVARKKATETAPTNGATTEELPEEGEPQNETAEGTVPPEQPAPPPEEPPAPTAPAENMSRAQKELEEIPRYDSLEDVYKEGEKYFQNATTGLMGLSNELDVLKYGMDRIKELDQMEADIRENLVYTDFLAGYNRTGRDFEEDIKDYSAQRIELDKKYQRYMTDGSLNETESQNLWNDTWRLERMNSEIRMHISGGVNSTKLWWGSSDGPSPFPGPRVPMFDPQGTEAAKKLFGENLPLRPDRPDDGLIDSIYYNLQEDYDILSQARQEIENRQREPGVRQ